MDLSQFDLLLHDAEVKLKRLKALYEQWFTGIERIEPLIARKDLDRTFAILNKDKPRNTAARFRLQQLHARYSVYATYWGRIARQIEEGTYERDVRKARRQVGGMDRGRRDAQAYELDLDEEIELDGVEGDEFGEMLNAIEPKNEISGSRPLLSAFSPLALAGKKASIEPPPAKVEPAKVEPTKAAPPASAATFKKPASATFGKPAASIPPATGTSKSLAAPPAKPPAQEASAMKMLAPLSLELDDVPSAPPIVRPSTTPAQTPAGSKNDSPAPAAPASIASTKNDGLAPSVVKNPPAAPPSLASAKNDNPAQRVAHTAPVAPPTLASSKNDSPAPSVTKNPLAAPPSLTSAKNDSPAPASNVANAPPSVSEPMTKSAPSVPVRPAPPPALPSSVVRGAVAVPPPGGVRIPRPGQPAQKPAPPPSSSSDDPTLRRLYDDYVAARKRNNEKADNLGYDKIADSVRQMQSKLREKHGEKKIDFEVVVQDGKVGFKPKIG